MVEAAESAVRRRRRRRLGTGQQRPCDGDRQPAVGLRQGHLGRRGDEVRDADRVDGERHGTGRRFLRRSRTWTPARRSSARRWSDQHIGPALYVPSPTAVVAGNANGCNPYPAGSLTGKIALIQRGVCEFGVKVFNAQNAGAIGALIYNSTGRRRRAAGHGRRRRRTAGHDPVGLHAAEQRARDGRALHTPTRPPRRPSSSTTRTEARTRATSLPGSAPAGRRRTRTSSPTSSRRAWTSSRAATRRAVPGALHGLRVGLGHEHGDPACRRGRRAAAPEVPVVDAGDGQVGADDHGDRGRLHDDRPHDAGRRARPRRRADRPDEGRQPGPDRRQAEPERAAHEPPARTRRSASRAGTSAARRTRGTSPRSRPATLRRRRTSTSSPGARR